MMTTKEIAAMRDKLAAEYDMTRIQFPSDEVICEFVGMPYSNKYLEVLAASLKAEAKLRYMYADAMMEARKASKEVAEESVSGDDGWMNHEGGGIPCDEEKQVDIKLRNQSVFEDSRAGFWHDAKK